MQRRTHIIIACSVIGLLMLALVSDSLGSLLFLGGTLVGLVLPVALIVWVGQAIIRHLANGQPLGASATSAQLVAKYSAMPPTVSSTPLAQRLQTAFNRNQSAEIERILGELPAWSITQHIRSTAFVLLALKKSTYRAQAEGVPSKIVQRYLDNIAQASNSVWHLASRLDALGQQQASYAIVAQRLDQETARLIELQRSAQAAQNGIAVLIVAGIESDAVQRADEDFTHLTAAVLQLLQTHAKQATVTRA